MSRRCSVLFGFVLLLGAVAPAVAQDDEAVTLTRAQARALPDPQWTAETRAAAIPMPLQERDGHPYMPQHWTPPGEPGGVPGTLPVSVAGSPLAVAHGRILVDEEGPLLPEVMVFGGTDWYDYPPPHSLQPGFAWTYYPHSTLGKLFFTDGVDNFVCSGSAVTCPGDRDLVMTAGHCCSDGAGSFFFGFQFVPACRGPGCATAAPFGTWNWQQVTVLTAWHTGGDLARDVCWIKVAPNAMGQEIQDLTGALGMVWNMFEPQFHAQTGWPAEAPFNGGRLWMELASTADLDGSFTPNPVGKGSLMTGGSSGGGWIHRYRLNNANPSFNRWNGLNSYKYVPAREREMYGPYIDQLIRDVTTGGSVNCP